MDGLYIRSLDLGQWFSSAQILEGHTQFASLLFITTYTASYSHHSDCVDLTQRWLDSHTSYESVCISRRFIVLTDQILFIYFYFHRL